MEFDELSHRVIGCAIEVHKCLGPGLLESVYEQCLAFELSQAHIDFKLQHALPVNYKGAYRGDFIVQNELIIEFEVRTSHSRCSAFDLHEDGQGTSRVADELQCRRFKRGNQKNGLVDFR